MTKNILRIFCRFLRADKAVSALEYAVLAGVVVAGVGGAVVAFTGDVQDAMENLGTNVTATADTANSGSLEIPADE